MYWRHKVAAICPTISVNLVVITTIVVAIDLVVTIVIVVIIVVIADIVIAFLAIIVAECRIFSHGALRSIGDKDDAIGFPICLQTGGEEIRSKLRAWKVAVRSFSSFLLLGNVFIGNFLSDWSFINILCNLFNFQIPISIILINVF